MATKEQETPEQVTPAGIENGATVEPHHATYFVTARAKAVDTDFVCHFAAKMTLIDGIPHSIEVLRSRDGYMQTFTRGAEAESAIERLQLLDRIEQLEKENAEFKSKK